MKLLKAFLLTTSVILNACGAEPQIIYVYQSAPPTQQQAPMQSQYADPSFNQGQQLPNLNNPSQTVVPTQGSVPKAPVKPNTSVNPPLASAPKTVAPATATTAVSTEDKLLKKARDSFDVLQTVSASIKTYEDSGTVGTGQIKFLYKKPSSVKVEVISSSSSGQAGVKLSYSDPTNVQVRPSGMLSMVSVSLGMNDPKLLTGRKYQLNQIDLPTTVLRLTSPGAKAKLIGQSVVNGSPVYVVEITNKSFDPSITREVLSIDTKTFMPRMHEMYQGAKKVYAAEISTITVNPPLSATDFSV